MKRVDTADAAAGNLFTEGSSSLGIPATTVSADFMNSLQEEIAGVIEDAGITLDQTNVDLTQLLQALNYKIAHGGTQFSFAIVNNTTAAADVTPLVFDSTDVKSATIEFDIHRQSDTGSSNLDEKGFLHVLYDTVAGSWKITQSSVFDDSGVVFTISGAGQVKYTSSNIAGTNSVGTMKGFFRTIKA